MTTVSEKLDRLTRTGELYEKLEGGAVRCYACAHRCLIKPGRRGICQVRFNQDGELRVPHGYVAALQVDPIEKKPFSHLLPGADALTFGMLGCDFHCSYCFTGETIVMTDRGPVTLQAAFESAVSVLHQPDGDVAFIEGLQAATEAGQFRPIRAVFRHPYQGKMVVIKPYYLPEIHCTPDHKIYATLDPQLPLQAVPANQLTSKHYLAVPRQHAFSQLQTLDIAILLECYQISHHVRWKLTAEERQAVLTATEKGMTSRQIGEAMGKSASYIRHVRAKLARGSSDSKTQGPLVEDGLLRFSHEHHPGIPATIVVDENLARLLGYYCAEGSVVQSKNRPNSMALNFSFSPDETNTVEEVVRLLNVCFGVRAGIFKRDTTLCASVSKASLALLFKTLAGSGAREKRVPEVIFNSPRQVIEAFVQAYVEGDGYAAETGKVTATTVSRELAHGVGFLALKLGYLPSLYDTTFESEGIIQGRTVQRSTHQYTIVWYENDQMTRRLVKTETNYLIPVRSLSEVDFDGLVFNMEVEEIHKYLAGFALVSNCQNYVTSQTLRDPVADQGADYLQEVTPEELVQYAQRAGAKVMVSSYNEPLITSEWAVSVFQKAKEAGMLCAFVSNGNATIEALRYLRPYLSGYKVDLKTMQDKQYRRLGGVLNHVLDTIKMARELDLWVEVVTLVVPGFNDSNEELWDAARYIASVSTDIPWHVTAFHPDYKMDAEYTPSETLLRAAEIGQEAGLHYVYAGNLPGKVGTYEDTICPNCSHRLVQRRGYVVLDYSITAEGKCPKCGTQTPGVWPEKPETVRLHGPGYPRWARV